MSKRRYIPEVVEEMMKIAEKNGGTLHTLDPDIVVEKARDPQSPLHDAADWRWDDDKGAAHEYRVGIARALIRSIPESAITNGTHEQMIPAWVRDTRLPSGQRGYIHVAEVEPNSEHARTIVMKELAFAVANLRRAWAIADRLGLRGAIEALLKSAEQVQAQIETMPLSQPAAPKKRGRRPGSEKRI